MKRRSKKRWNGGSGSNSAAEGGNEDDPEAQKAGWEIESVAESRQDDSAAQAGLGGRKEDLVHRRIMQEQEKKIRRNKEREFSQQPCEENIQRMKTVPNRILLLVYLNAVRYSAVHLMRGATATLPFYTYWK